MKSSEEWAAQVDQLERRIEREQRARLSAETIAEKVTTELYGKQRDLVLLQRITAAANLAAHTTEALETLVDLVCEHVGWPVGHAFLVNGERLHSLNIWKLSDSESFRAFCDSTSAIDFSRGVGLPGRVLAEKAPVWVTDVMTEGNFPRAAAAQQIGIRAGFGFPIFVGEDVVAVAEFFSLVAIPPDAAVVDLLRLLGTQIGRVFERERTAAKLVFDAMHDSLTGLPNRALLLDRLRHAFARVRRFTSERFAVLVVDLDRFKVINDSLGHRVGDEFLKLVAERLRSSVRQFDMVARLGGDEFAVLLENVANLDGAQVVVERILQAVATPGVVASQDVVASASIGLALWQPEYSSPEDILRDANTAMYHAKNSSTIRHAVFASAMRERVVKQLRVETDLRRAIEREELRLYYQPIVSLNSGCVTGFEALIRWQHAQQGLVPPLDFIPLAEETGLIRPIGHWVIREACAQLARWQREGRSAISLSINLSGRQFIGHELVEQIAKAIADHGVTAAQITFEITESVLLDAGLAETTLAALKTLGVRLALDDFGTGYSSLSHLHRFAFDSLKIDRSFVSAMNEDSKHGDIVRAILLLARGLQLTVVAEGVELLEQARSLANLGCEFGQGYYFSRPLPSDGATTLLTSAREWSIQAPTGSP